ncbi:aspartic proteinase-like protein 1 isoform X2 [Andrographis paniculata]|uniref:aspartic proteinase-like protein 1 isoform X2 n=1 Tax=Andrographis paniculata TaxID=175694 RepID=UPI0021E8C874|nr:aspartic proteinase-like protein 1 isoform X2 [Andrographis paniculata]
MGKTHPIAAFLVMLLATDSFVAGRIYSSRLIHRFSDEVQALLMGTGTASWPERKSFRHMRLLLGNDLRRQRQRLRLWPNNQTLVVSQGGQTSNYGNDMGWLHYAWINVGTPNNSFLVALDTGSDMFWVPCDCVKCAPLSLSNYNKLDKELGEYSPAHSSSSKQVPCSHELCEMAPNCNTPKEHCPYATKYMSDDTSSSGFLFEDLLHLASAGGNTHNSSDRATVIVGCGSRQSGEYLEGIAPDGVMGLGPGDISVPSLLAKSGFVPHSLSFCYDKSYSGRLFIGDRGPPSQKSTSFLDSEQRAYFVEVEMYCVEGTCLKQTGNTAQVDTGSTFTFLPDDSYDQVVAEFHRQANASRTTYDVFDYCYQASALKGPNIPSLKLVFSLNQTFVVENPTFHAIEDEVDVRCLGILRIDGNIGLIGQNLMMGYRIVFDWEKQKLGWSASNCEDIDGVHSTPSPNSDGASPNPLPTTEQQNNHSRAVAPALAGRASPSHSPDLSPFYFCSFLHRSFSDRLRDG